MSSLSGESVSCYLWHRRKLSVISECLLQDWQSGWSPCAWSPYALRRPTRGSLAAHSRSFEMPRSRTVQFSRSFVLSCVRLWYGFYESDFAGEGLGAFKTSVNRFLLQGCLSAVFFSFSSTISLPFFLFSGPKIAWGLRSYRLFAFTRVVFGLLFFGGGLVGSRVCFNMESDTWDLLSSLC